jgi:hypothetical protein
MKKIILILLPLLAAWAGYAQDGTFRRVTVRDSIFINGRWISAISTDSTLSGNVQSTVSTQGAVKKYIDNAIATNAVTAENGLVKENGVIKLGGDLTGATNINLASWPLLFYNSTIADNFYFSLGGSNKSLFSTAVMDTNMYNGINGYTYFQQHNLGLELSARKATYANRMLSDELQQSIQRIKGEVTQQEVLGAMSGGPLRHTLASQSSRYWEWTLLYDPNNPGDGPQRTRTLRLDSAGLYYRTTPRVNGNLQELFRLDSAGGFTLSKFRNNAATDSLLTTDVNGRFKLVADRNIYLANGSLTSDRLLTGQNRYSFSIGDVSSFAVSGGTDTTVATIGLYENGVSLGNSARGVPDPNAAYLSVKKDNGVQESVTQQLGDMIYYQSDIQNAGSSVGAVFVKDITNADNTLRQKIAHSYGFTFSPYAYRLSYKPAGIPADDYNHLFMVDTLGNVVIPKYKHANADSVLTVDQHGVLKLKSASTVVVKTAGNVPQSSSDPVGNTGDCIADDNYLYIRTGTGWKRLSLSTF